MQQDITHCSTCRSVLVQGSRAFKSCSNHNCDRPTYVMTSPPLPEELIDQHTPGAKLDSGKQRAHLVLGGFPRALQEVVRVGTYGSQKYTDNGWKVVPNATSRYSDALWRHLLEDAKGLQLDEESGLQHLAHAAWNILALLEFRAQEKNRASWLDKEESK